MGLILESSVTEAFCLILISMWSFYCYVTKNYDFWQKRGVPCADAVFPFGTLTDVALGQSHIGRGYDRCYKRFKGVRFFGVIDGRVPALVVNDLDLIKRILTKDFRHFSDRISMKSLNKNEFIINHLFNMSGMDWKEMRLTLTPTFTSGKMKMMFSLVEKCSDQLHEHMDKQLKADSVVDVKDILARFTMNIIASCAFGLDLNSLSDKDCEFYRVGAQIFKTTKLRMFRRIWYNVMPIFSKLYAPPIVSSDITEFFTKIIRDTVGYREQNSVIRNDFLDLLIKIRHNKSVFEIEDNTDDLETDNKQCNSKKGLTIEEITAQSFIFFAAGFETASSTAAFCLYEITCNPEIQEKLYQEIKEILAKHGGKPNYQALQEMVYMEQVINETLRLYSSLAFLNRTCTESYQIPDSEVVIQKGLKIVIPIFSIHHDPEYYPDPYKFDPERFTEEKVKERHPYLHLPFGGGPRMCIGMRFGMMQTKIALTTMVYNYKFHLTPETEIPVQISKKAMVTLPEKPVLLQLKKRKMDF